MIFLIAGVLYFDWQTPWKGNLLLCIIISTVYTLISLTITLLGVSTTKISFGCHQQKSYFKMAQSEKGNLLAHMTVKPQGQLLLAAGNILFEELAFGQQDLLLSLPLGPVSFILAPFPDRFTQGSGREVAAVSTLYCVRLTFSRKRM